MIKILILPLFGIGDVLMTTPAMKLLKENLDNAVIHLFVMKKKIYELFYDYQFVDRIIFYPLLEKSKLDNIRFIFSKILWKYDYAINFYPSNRMQYNILSLLTGAKKRIGHYYNNKNFSQLNFLKNLTIKEDDNLHCVEENIRLLEFFDIKTDNIPQMNINLKQDEVIFGKNFVNKFSGIKKIGIHVGSSTFKNHKFRRWPKEYFLNVINYFKEYSFFLFGGIEEKYENEYILKNSKYKNVILVKDSIRNVAAIIKNLDLFVSNDSGIMHLSASVGTKTLGIFGPTNPKWVSPWGKDNDIVRLDLACSPCFVYSPEPLKCGIKNKWKCLKELKPEKVIAKIKEMI